MCWIALSVCSYTLAGQPSQQLPVFPGLCRALQQAEQTQELWVWPACVCLHHSGVIILLVAHAMLRMLSCLGVLLWLK